VQDAVTENGADVLSAESNIVPFVFKATPSAPSGFGVAS
jgi:hypothetical protein